MQSPQALDQGEAGPEPEPTAPGPAALPEDAPSAEMDAQASTGASPRRGIWRPGWLDGRRAWLILLAGFVFVRGLLWLAVVPPWQGPDEPGHFEYVALIYHLGRIPSPRPNVEVVPELTYAINESVRAQRFEQFHPTLSVDYHHLFSPPWLVGPREAGYQLPTYYLLIYPIYWLLRDNSILAQFYGLAAFSIVLGVVTVLAAAGAARAVLPGNRWAQAAVPLLVAFWPTQSHMLTRINNDNLATASAALVFWLGANVMRYGLRPWSTLGLAAALSLAVFAKGTSLFIAAFGAAVFAYGLARLLPRYGPRVLDVIMVALGLSAVTVAVAALYYPPVAEQLMELAQRLPPGNRVQTYLREAFKTLAAGLHLQPERLAVNADQALFTLKSFWAVFGWGSYFLPRAWYSLAAGAASLAFAGWLWLLAWPARRATLAWDAWHWRTLALFVVSIPVALAAPAARMIFDPFDIAFHGRILQTLLAPVAVLLVIGWQQWTPRAWRTGALVGLALLLLLLDAVIFTAVLLPRFYS